MWLPLTLPPPLSLSLSLSLSLGFSISISLFLSFCRHPWPLGWSLTVAWMELTGGGALLTDANSIQISVDTIIDWY